MGHIHDLIDYTVNVIIVHDGKALFVHHDALDLWLPVGGHIELDEDPEQALYREVQEECGLEIQLFQPAPDIPLPHGRMLPVPQFMDIHDITPTHRHVGLVYFATSKSDQVTLETDAHRAIEWLSRDDLDDPKYQLLPNIKHYAQVALDRLS